MKAPFKDEEIKEIVERKIRQSVGMYDSQLSKERETVLRYYNQESPKRAHPGSASYVITTVYDSVESMKAQLLDIFATGRDIIQFAPQNSKDVEAARIASDYTNYVVSRQNNMFGMFQTVIDDGLKARIGVVKVYWDEVKTLEDREFDGLDEGAVSALAADDDVTDLDADADPMSGLYAGKLTIISEDKSQVRIDVVAPEDFGIEPEAKALEGSFHYHRVLKTRAEIKAMGFDIAKIKDKNGDANSTEAQDLEVVARFNPISSGYNPRDSEGNTFWLYECYTHLEKGDRRALYKIVRVAGEILDIEEVDRSPFKVFTPLPVSHSFWGNNFAKLSIPAQNATTMLTRGILDHTAITTNPRWMVVQGGLTNPKELLDNRLGGLVNVKSPDSIVPMPQATLNQYVFPTIDLIKKNNEETTGISSLSTGMNKDVISNQNSQAMVNDLVDLSMTRSKTIARNFAYGFLVPLFLEVHRLVLENEKRTKIVELAGNYVEINPRTWIARVDADVTLHLSAADAQAEAMKYTQLLTMASSDPALNSMITSKNRYALAQKVISLMGIKNVGDYITAPEMIPPAEPDPMAVAQMEMAKQQTQAGLMAAQAQLLKAQTDASHKAHADQMAELNAQITAMRTQMDLMRKQLETESRVDIAQRETNLLEQQAATGDGNTRGIISP